MKAENSWQMRHLNAVAHPETAMEATIVSLLQGAKLYADYFCDDGVLRRGLPRILRGIRVLLDGDLGRLDGGSIDREIWRLAEQVGYDLDSERWND